LENCVTLAEGIKNRTHVRKVACSNPQWGHR